MPAKFPVIGRGDPWAPPRKETKTFDSGLVIRAMCKQERREAFRNEWTAFWASRFGVFASCWLWACIAFLAIVLALDWTGVLPIVGGRN